ncbi:MAG: divergent polysaccharide deacetylase family protein [Alphaproteobacteria bacterium]|nr:divergent polysaccharide deacetylase family protein [Alphaproteobacteria bacterium]
MRLIRPRLSVRSSSLSQSKRRPRKARRAAPVFSPRALGVAAIVAAALTIGVIIGASFDAPQKEPSRPPATAEIRPAKPAASPPAVTPPAIAPAPPQTAAPAPAPLPAPVPTPAETDPALLLPPLAAGRGSGGESALPPWRRYAAQAPEGNGRPMIALVIDDMGMDRKRSRRAVQLPAQVTLAYLPYADEVAQQVEQARRAGHEILVHLPMEASDRGAYPGPNALMVDLEPGEILRRLRWNLDRLSGYVGVNNHMGSRFTAHAPGMEMVLAELKARGLLFLDSRTSSESLAGRMARHMALPSASRDVFLDHIETAENVAGQLQLVEELARRQGRVIAIGHPHDATLDQLERWLPTLGRKGLILAPLSAVIARSYQG